MFRWLTIILIFSGIQLNAGVKIEKVYLDKKFTGYLVTSKFFNSVVFAPNELKRSPNAVNIVRGGWFRNLTLKDSEDLLAACKAPDGTVRYGLAQVFEPLMELPEAQKEFILPGVGKGVIDNNGNVNIKEFFPWTSKISFSGENKENASISFYQDSDKDGKKLDYKMRIDCNFTDSAIVEIQGVFLNLGNKPFKAQISPVAIFNNSTETPGPWIAVPHQSSRKLKTGRTTYIDSAPLAVKDMRDYYEFSQDRLSKAKRWVAVGGLQQNGMLAFLSETVLEKVVFWKTNDCFSVFPCIKLESQKEERIEWSWKIFIGKGLNSVNSVSEKGIIGTKLSKLKNGYQCEIQFLPTAKSKDLIMDVMLKSVRGMILAIKSYEMFDSSPLKPESIIMKLPRQVQPNNRYSLKVELLKDGNISMTMDQWLFPE